MTGFFSKLFKNLYFKNKNIALLSKPYRYFINYLSKDFPYLIRDINSYNKLYIKDILSIIPDNNFYSIRTILQNLNISIDEVYCEHGLYFGNYFPEKLKNSWIKDVVTFSEFRGEVIRSNKKNAILLGPYIHYVEPIEDHYFDEEYFLVMITHSAKGIKLKQNYNLNKHVLSLEKKFGIKSLLLIHPNDFNTVKGYNLNYTTCGLMEDKYFLNRLKRLILDSKFVVTDFIGTHIGYITFLNKKIFAIKKSFTYEGSKENFKNEFGERILTDLYISQISKLENEIKYDEFIESDIFYQLVSEYWGFKHIKSSL
jgi:hypothetical protein